MMLMLMSGRKKRCHVSIAATLLEQAIDHVRERIDEIGGGGVIGEFAAVAAADDCVLELNLLLTTFGPSILDDFEIYLHVA